MNNPLDRTGTWRTYSLDSGLAGLRIEHIAEDSEGYLWFATWDNGASRFDGDEFQTFTQQDGLVHDRIFSIYKDSQGRLWFGTLQGVCWYDGVCFHPLEDESIAGRMVKCIYEDRQGRIWFGGNSTLGCYDNAVFHDLIPLYLQHYQQPPSPYWTDQCWGITQDPQGHLWFGFDYLIRYDGETFHRYEEAEGFPQDESSYALCHDQTGKMWIGRRGYRDGVWCYADGAFQPIQVDLGGPLRKIQCDREGRMWFCTSEGVLYQDGDGFSRFTPADGLPHPAAKTVFQDREHQFWFATWGGVGLYDTHSISVFDPSAELSQNVSEVSQIVQDRRGDIWIGYVSPHLNPLNKSVARFDGEHFAFVGTDQGFDINNCFAIYEDFEGYLWFGGRNGLFRYDGQNFKKMEIVKGFREMGVSTIAQDYEGQFLFGVWENDPIKDKELLFTSPLQIVYHREGQSQTIFVERKKKDPFSRIGTVIVGRNSEVWFHLACNNFSGRGFARWHPEDGLKFYRIEDGLTDHRIADLLLDRQGNLWIATQSGLCRFDGSTFHTFTTEDGLPSNHIRCLYEDSQGHLWIGTHGGVVHYNGQFFQTIKSSHIGPVCQILEDSEGTFWFGTALGSLVRYRLRQIPPRIRLLQVISDQVYENPEEVVLSTTDQHVIFEYKGLSFSTRSRDMLYIYRLKGYDPDWRSVTRDMRAHYRDLPPGDYTFQVRAIDRDLNYSEIAQARLSIEPDSRIRALTTALNSNSEDGKAFIGQSRALHQFQIELRKVASTDLTVLILGETGVGKGLAARELHGLSAHCDGPFIQINCGALPETLIDSELFGHERGAFTSAVSRRLGKVELAKDGTLFLDEIGDMMLETQIKLLRLLEEGTFERIGGNQTLRMQTRIVVATNRNLKEMVSAGAFREDLYYRLQAFPLYLPPLRERKEDISDLAEFFKNRMAAHLGRQIAPLRPEVIEMLQIYDWPGNVRELEHTINRAVIVCPGYQIEVGDLGLYGVQIEDTALDRERISSDHDLKIIPLDEFERHYISEVLKATTWRIKGPKGAATLLGLPPSTLYHRMNKLGIKRP